MKKTMIALAVAATLPVTAVADVTLSGSVSAKYTSNTKALDVDSDLDIASTEVLANGMTATASFDVGSEGNSGKASLSGDFGTLTVGSALDSDGAFQSGDVAAVVADTTETATTASTTNAIHYSGDMAGLTVQAQINAGSDASGTTTGTTAETTSNQFGATYEFNGLTAGYSYISADADANDSTGVDAAQTATGISYAFGDLTVTAGKGSLNAKGTYSASYSATFGDLAVVATVKDANGTDSNTVLATYTMGEVSFTADIDSTKDNSELGASFVSGDVTATVTRGHDRNTDVTVAMAMGNASLTAKRDGSAASTSVTYKVSF